MTRPRRKPDLCADPTCRDEVTRVVNVEGAGRVISVRVCDDHDYWAINYGTKTIGHAATYRVSTTQIGQAEPT